MTHYLPYPTARRLYDAGLKLQTETVYFVIGEHVREVSPDDAMFLAGCNREDGTKFVVIPRPRLNRYGMNCRMILN